MLTTTQSLRLADASTVTGPKKAEQMFDAVAFDYETVYAEHCNHLVDVLTHIVNFIPPNSRVLDIGSGTGKPTAAFFASRGHKVTGLDISQTMVDLARQQVPQAEFYKADMTVYQPPNGEKFDLVVASHSLYQFPLPGLRSQIFRFSRWIKKGGLVAIGTCLKPDEMNEQGLKYDHRGWVEGLTERFMGHQAKCTVGLPKAWCRFFEDAGMEILDVNQRVCMPVGGAPSDKQDQFFVMGRKTVDEELLGPYPLPKKPSNPFKVVETNLKAFLEFTARATREDIQAVVKVLQQEGSKSVLCIGNGSAALARLLGKHCDIICYIEFPDQATIKNLPSNAVAVKGSVDSLPFGDQTFDAVVSLWSLSYAPSPARAINELLRVAAPKATIMLIQAAPYNEFINLINEALRGLPNVPVHDGILLEMAAKTFAHSRFNQISFDPVDGHIKLPDAEGERRVQVAKELLSKLWSANEQDWEAVGERMTNPLRRQFLDSPGKIGNQSVLMVSKRESN